MRFSSICSRFSVVSLVRCLPVAGAALAAIAFSACGKPAGTHPMGSTQNSRAESALDELKRVLREKNLLPSNYYSQFGNLAITVDLANWIMRDRADSAVAAKIKEMATVPLNQLKNALSTYFPSYYNNGNYSQCRRVRNFAINSFDGQSRTDACILLDDIIADGFRCETRIIYGEFTDLNSSHLNASDRPLETMLAISNSELCERVFAR